MIVEILVQSAFQQTLGDKFTFQQDANLKHKAKYTLSCLPRYRISKSMFSLCHYGVFGVDGRNKNLFKQF